MTWVRLVADDELGPGAVVGLDIGDVEGVGDRPGAGLEVVVWRVDEGPPVVCSARCPHAWSDLGRDGTVSGGELVCGAHFWRFDRAGRGTKRAMSGRRDAKADLATWDVRARDGWWEADLPVPPTETAVTLRG